MAAARVSWRLRPCLRAYRDKDLELLAGNGCIPFDLYDGVSDDLTHTESRMNSPDEKSGLFFSKKMQKNFVD